ncbi:MAG: bis(5'-nucleosyl)-tetraphosphatase (symmetrical) YqeK [Oscillospiraceae bacterium]
MENINEYKKIVRSFLSDKRYEHSVAVSKEAMRLAKKYGADEKKAETAGILHDIMKESPPDTQLETIADFGVVLNDIELSTKKLWHQIAAAVYAENVLHIADGDVINAIRYHTSGRGNMSILEKVIFIADFTSKDRDYNGVEDMRRLAEKSLEAAMAEGLSFVLIELAEEKRPIIADTIEAYNQAITNL